MFTHLTQDFFGYKESRSIGWPFLCLGFLFGSWATFIPFVKNLYLLNDADLGLLLLSLPMGAVTMNPLAAWLVNKKGMQKATLIGLYSMAIAFLLPLNMPIFFLLPLSLYACGASISITNVAMNTVVGALEKRHGIHIMSTCHGLFSVGLSLGSLCSGLVYAYKLVPGIYFLFCCSVVLLGALRIKTVVLGIQDVEESHASSQSGFQWPKGSLLVMILIGLCNNFAEGAMTDWSSVYMKDVVAAPYRYVGWGLAAYSFCMATGRLFGDALIPRFGGNSILVAGGILSTLGIVLFITFPHLVPSILGFGLVGLGVSCVAPILYAASARVPGMRKGAGLALMNTFAMGSFMVGPVIIGFISEGVNLSFALGVVALLCLVWTFLGARVKLF